MTTDSTARSDSALGGPDFMAFPCGSGPREPSPSVSALRASVPNAWRHLNADAAPFLHFGRRADGEFFTTGV